MAEDLKIPVKDAAERDDPTKYYYKVQILDEEKQSTGKANEKNKGKETNKSKYSGTLMDVRCTDMRCVWLLYINYTYTEGVLPLCGRRSFSIAVTASRSRSLSFGDSSVSA